MQAESYNYQRHENVDKFSGGDFHQEGMSAVLDAAIGQLGMNASRIPSVQAIGHSDSYARTRLLNERMASRGADCLPFIKSQISRFRARFSCAPGMYSDVARSMK